jgi:hypothetical protein
MCIRLGWEDYMLVLALQVPGKLLSVFVAIRANRIFSPGSLIAGTWAALHYMGTE